MSEKQGTILVVDDSLVNLRVVEGALSGEFIVNLASGGYEGLQKADELRPDLILLDILMPDLSGYDVCSQLKANPELSDIPVTFLSALNQIKDEYTGLALGAADYISKPFNIGLLQLRVRTHLELKRKRDLLQQQKNELTQLVEQLRLAGSVFENSSEGIVITDHEERILAVNPAFTKVTGYTSAEVCGMTPRAFKSQRHDLTFYKAMWHQLKTLGLWRGEIWNRRKNGEVYPELLSISAVKDTNDLITHYVAVFTDISALKEKESQLDYLAYHDPLTNLANRLMFANHQALALERANRLNSLFALLLLDLDHFKDINDSFGHPVGDELLQQVAQRIAGRLRGADSISRLGGDEFTVLIEDIHDHQDAAWLASDLIELFRKPFPLPLSGEVIQIGVSIGIALYPEHGRSCQELLQQADAALYRAKAEGRNRFRFFTEELTRKARERIDLETQLRLALDRNELVLHYQPQLELHSGRIIGVEALVRWQHPKLGMIAPDQFIPVAEQNGLIEPLGKWVLQEACRQGVCWLQAGIPPLRMAVNLSPHQLHHDNIVQSVKEILDETGFPISQLELEITETALMEHASDSLNLLQRINMLGVLISLDDFGTGYSSLARIKQLPLHLLKIDRSFIKDILHDKADREITATIIAMSQTLGFKVLAEGVEEQEQMDLLKTLNCTYYQGYLASRPLPATDITRLLLAETSKNKEKQ